MDESLTTAGLLRGAKKFAHSAMDAHTEGDREVFFLHAGVSIERLAKAVLADTSPFLLMEMKGNDETLLHLTGVRETARVRTIGAAQSIDRLRKIGYLSSKGDDLDELIELRNGVAHLAEGGRGSFDGLTAFARTTKELLRRLTVTHEEYWGVWETIIAITLNNALEKAQRDLGRLIEQARVRLHQRIHKLPTAAAEAYVQAFTIRVPRVNTRSRVVQVSVPKKCPACSYMGQITTGLPPLTGERRLGEAYPIAFGCPVCSLRLETVDLLSVADMYEPVRRVDHEGNRYFPSETEEFLLAIATSGGHDNSDGEHL
nr:hypothetical protein StreXyl84_29820 [Streptomyces sp. Xyl84]